MKKSLVLLLFVWVLSLFSSMVDAQDISQRIMFLSDFEGSTAIYTMQADGTEIEKLTDIMIEVGGEITSADLSPDGMRLAVSSRKDRNGQLSDEIFVLDLAAGIVTQITSDGRNNTLPKWSPDSQHLAYLADGRNAFSSLYILNLATLTRQILASSMSLAPVVSHDPGPVIRDFDWSPSGSQLVLGARIGLPDVIDMLIVINVDSTNTRQVTPNETYVGPITSWGADQNVIYTVCAGNSNNEICRLNLQTNQIQSVTNLQASILNAQEPYVTSLDIDSEGRIIFKYGVINPGMYVFNTVTGALNLVPGISFDFQLLGWVEIPKFR